MNILRYLLVIASLTLVSRGFAQPPAQFLRANEDYAQGRFKEAIEGYEDLVRIRPWNPPLFYDLGNAYFRAGDFGRAILNYERALALEPHHPEAAANLQIARDEARALELPKNRTERLLKFTALNQLTVAAAVAFWIGIFAVAILIFSSRRSRGPVAIAFFGLVLFILCAVSGFEIYRTTKDVGIVTGKTVEARLATADNANPILALPPGSEVRILNRRGEWIYAALPNNLHGWLPAQSVEPVRL